MRRAVSLASAVLPVLTIRATTKQSEAYGAYCAICDQDFNITTCPYWHWSKSVWMHRNGTGHKVEMYRIVRA